MSWCTVNDWGMECLIRSSDKNTVNCTEETCKLGYQKNDRKVDITFDYFGP